MRAVSIAYSLLSLSILAAAAPQGQPQGSGGLLSYLPVDNLGGTLQSAVPTLPSDLVPDLFPLAPSIANAVAPTSLQMVPGLLGALRRRASAARAETSVLDDLALLGTDMNRDIGKLQASVQASATAEVMQQQVDELAKKLSTYLNTLIHAQIIASVLINVSLELDAARARSVHVEAAVDVVIIAQVFVDLHLDVKALGIAAV
ncbi:hypothetical protein BOTBODRAFT_532839 [Botryobasidium botryosum FD-172 SS1]|uniref:Uncharacterized protein n=1 Tax=Botryobasidium botryosum (strain FD-172 SS1) TaxID=930990 RepID=A0A067M3S2_BOTB1|nr:hypothetical protein BOTBODRAFT_532839 [Botryobasidium botryosum FD-172 SS1]